MQYPKLRQRKRRTEKRRFSPGLEGKENEFGARDNRSAPEPRNESHADDTHRAEDAGGNRGNDEQPALLRDTPAPADKR